MFIQSFDGGTEAIVQAIIDWGNQIATWATAFAEYFLNFLGTHAILIIPIVLMFIVLGIETIRRLIHGL